MIVNKSLDMIIMYVDIIARFNKIQKSVHVPIVVSTVYSRIRSQDSQSTHHHYSLLFPNNHHSENKKKSVWHAAYFPCELSEDSQNNNDKIIIIDCILCIITLD